MTPSAEEMVVKHYEVSGSNTLAAYFFLWFLNAALLLIPASVFFMKMASSHRLVLFCYRATYMRKCKYTRVQIIENLT